MGSPRRLKKKYRTPNNPFEKDRIVEEFVFIGQYGLRNKKELWKHKYQLSHWRKLARETRTLPEDMQKIKIKELVGSLSKYGLVAEDCHTDDILSLSIEMILNRRLQSFVHKQGLAKTVMQARQLVTHGHIAVKGKIIDSPSYLVKAAEESHITYAVNSPFSQDRSKLWGAGKPAPEEEIDA